MCILFNTMTVVDSQQMKLPWESKSLVSSAYTNNAITINSIGHKNETSKIRLFDNLACYLEHWWPYDYLYWKYSVDFAIIVDNFL